MARSVSTLIKNNQAYAEFSFAPTVDLRMGGQNGFIPDFRSYLSNSAYVQRNVIPFLLEYPRGFDHMPNTAVWIGTLKALVETQAQSIEGLNGTVSVEYVSNAIGASGEQQEDFSQVTRARSTPSFTWVEKQGRPIHTFFNGWIFYLIAHPDTQTPMIGSLEMNKGKYFDFLPDFNSMSVLFVEPDPFQRRVIEAWLCVNMMPKGSGELNGKRDIASAMSDRKVTVEFTAMTMMSMGVNQFAQAMLNQLNYIGLNPHNRRSAIETVRVDIAKASIDKSGLFDGYKDNSGGKVGFVAQVDEVAKSQRLDQNDIAGKGSSIDGVELSGKDIGTIDKASNRFNGMPAGDVGWVLTSSKPATTASVPEQ